MLRIRRFSYPLKFSRPCRGMAGGQSLKDLAQVDRIQNEIRKQQKVVPEIPRRINSPPIEIRENRNDIKTAFDQFRSNQNKKPSFNDLDVRKGDFRRTQPVKPTRFPSLKSQNDAASGGKFFELPRFQSQSNMNQSAFRKPTEEVLNARTGALKNLVRTLKDDDNNSNAQRITDETEKKVAPTNNSMSSMRESYTKILSMPAQKPDSPQYEHPYFANAKKVRDDILSNLDVSQKSSGNTGSKSVEEDSDDAVRKTVGERHHERKQLHLKIKQKEYQISLGKNKVEGSGAKPIFGQPKVFDIAEFKRQTEYQLKLEREMQAYQQQLSSLKGNVSAASSAALVIKEVVIPHTGFSARELASKLSMRIVDLRKKLIELGEEMEGSDRDTKLIDADVVELVVLELGVIAKRLPVPKTALQEKRELSPSFSSNCHELQPRAPVVCVMGHVDHGKTTLLDALRKFGLECVADPEKSATSIKAIAGSEAGGITQKLSAFPVAVNHNEGEKKVVLFLDTPGHAAFSAMRNYGATATDIVVLVVAIDDGVRPQTVEAAKTALEAGSRVIIAVNKADKIPAANREASVTRVLTQLLDVGLVAEQFGGDVQAVLVSGKTGEGLPALIESIILQAEIMDLKAANEGLAEGVVLDTHIEKGRGVVAEVLIKWGKMQIGDCVVMGSTFGKVKAMEDYLGNAVTVALPSQSVRLLGLRSGSSILGSGTAAQALEIITVDSEGKAKQITDRRRRMDELRRSVETDQQHQIVLKKKAAEAAKIEEAVQAAAAEGLPAPPVSAAPLIPQVNVVLKADGLGPLEALRQIVLSISSQCTDVVVRLLASSVGDISRSDIEMACISAMKKEKSSKAPEELSYPLLLAFNVGISDSIARAFAKEMDVKIARDNVIYRLEEELISLVGSCMPKERFTHLEGSAKVMKVFQLNDKKGTVVAGMAVNSGRMKKSNNNDGQYVFRVLRVKFAQDPNPTVILDDFSGSVDLKRFKDNVGEVEQGKECGLSLESFNDFKEGDEVQCYRVEWKLKPLKLETTSADNRADYWAAAGAAASSKTSSVKEGIEMRM